MISRRNRILLSFPKLTSGFNLIDEAGISIDVKAGTFIDDLSIICSTLAFVCRAICNPWTEGFLSSSTSCRPTVETGPLEKESTNKKLNLKLHFGLNKTPLQELQYNCWQQIFACVVVAEGDGQDFRYVTPGRGLEVSFDLMVALTTVEYTLAVGGSIVLAGHQMALLPTKVGDYFVQFHWEVNKSEQINPYIPQVECDKTVAVQDVQTFRQKSCFIGWCEQAHIHLGTSDLIHTFKYSGAKEKKRTLKLQGLSAGVQAVSTVPIQTGIDLQVSYILVSNRLSFPASAQFAQILRTTTSQLAILYDVETKRSWLVPKLSLMLHMCHTWHTAHEDGPNRADPIPFADRHSDGHCVVRILDGHGDITVCGSGEDRLSLRTLLVGLNLNLLHCIDKADEASRSNLYGFEFMDIICGPGRGSCMKQVNISYEGRGWLRMAQFVDALVI